MSKTKTERQMWHKSCKSTRTGTYHPEFNETRTTVKDIFVNDSVTYGDNLPDWKARIRNGQDCTTSLNGTRTSVSITPGIAVRQQLAFDVREETVGHLAQLRVNPTPGVADASIVNQATTSAAVAFSRNFRNNTRNWQSGVFFGEIAETAALLANPVRHLRGSVDSLYRDLTREIRRLGGLGLPRALLNKRRRELLADTWLIWSFGVKPTIQDCNDAAEAFRAMRSGRDFEIVRITGTGAAEGRVAALSSGVPVALAPVAGVSSFCAATNECTDRVQVTYRGAWKNSAASGEMPLPMRFGLTLSDIVPTAWEVIPWSFLVDYFTNIGVVLDAWSVGNVNFAWLNRTTRSRRTVKYSDAIATPLAGEYRYASGGHAKVVTRTVKREKVSSFNDVHFQVKIPGMGSLQWLNIAALAQMRLRPY